MLIEFDFLIRVADVLMFFARTDRDEGVDIGKASCSDCFHNMSRQTSVLNPGIGTLSYAKLSKRLQIPCQAGRNINGLTMTAATQHAARYSQIITCTMPALDLYIRKAFFIILPSICMHQIPDHNIIARPLSFQ